MYGETGLGGGGGGGYLSMKSNLHVHVYTCFNERKEGRSKQGQTNNKAKQHSTPKAVTFPKKNELPQVGLKPTTLYMYMYMYVLEANEVCSE